MIRAKFTMRYYTCNCKNGRLKNLCKNLRPKPFLIEDSAYLTSADPGGLQNINEEKILI